MTDLFTKLGNIERLGMEVFQGILLLVVASKLLLYEVNDERLVAVLRKVIEYVANTEVNKRGAK